LSDILDLDEQEAALLGRVIARYETGRPEQTALIRQRFECLRGLGRAISQYPSARECWNQEMPGRDIHQYRPSSRILHVPARIVAARCFLVAKCQAFTLLCTLVRDDDGLYQAVRRVIFSVICTLMAEDVYFSCLEDPAFPKDIKNELAGDLITLWDRGIDPRQVHYLPLLEELWIARIEAPPSFGTMDGASELIRISIDLDKEWNAFLAAELPAEETRQALEEFLFGLSYEEILQIRAKLARLGITAVGQEEVRLYLETPPAYAAASGDLRGIYDFYVDRQKAAAFRRRTGASGPWKTLEEIYLQYRIKGAGRT